MKTPMQELISAIRKRQEDEDVQPFMWHEQIVELAESLLEEEENLLIKTHGNKKVYDSQIDPTIVTGEEWYNKTFKTKER